MTKEKEEWRLIKDGLGCEVSNLGRVRDSNGRILKPRAISGGKMLVTKRDENRHFSICIHVAVLETFVKPKENGYKAHFKDGDKSNNRLDNLEWIETDQKKRKDNPTKREPPYGYLTAKQVSWAMQHYKPYSHGSEYTLRSMADKFGVTEGALSRALKRERKRREAEAAERAKLEVVLSEPQIAA